MKVRAFPSGKLQTIRFNASTDSVSRTTHLPPSITSFTMMAWVRQVTLPAFPIFLTFAGNGAGTGRYYTALGDADGNQFTLYSSAASFGTAGSALAAGTWYHVAMTVSGTGASQFLGYLNGKLDSTHTGDNTGIGAGASLWFGSANDNQSMDGYIAAGKVFNRPLTAGEIQREMMQYVPVLGHSEGLNSWMPFSGPSAELAMADFGLYAKNFTANSIGIEDLAPPIPWVYNKRSRIFVKKPGAAAYLLTAESGSYAWTGSATSLEVGREVAADSGTYTWTGTAASLKLGTKVAANAGAYTWSGSAASLLHTKKVAANSGSYTWTGTAAGVFLGTEIAANSGTYTWTGTAANFPRTYRVIASAGAYTWTGSTADLIYSSNDPVLNAEAGAYVWTGSAATLKLGTKVAANAGSFSWTGSAANLLRGYKVAANAGAFTWSGSPTSLELGYELLAESGTFSWTGSNATLTWSGEQAPVSTPGYAGWQASNFR